MPFPVAAVRGRSGRMRAGSLLSSLNSYFRLNEASGDTTELLSSTTITATNGPDANTGKLYPNARQLAVASVQYFIGAQPQIKAMIGPLSYAVWQYPYSWGGVAGTNRRVFDSYGAVDGGFELLQNWSGESVVGFYSSAGVPGDNFFWHAGAPSTPTLNQWNLTIVTYDRATGAVSLRLNGTTLITTTWATGPLGPGVAYRSFAIGNISSGALLQCYNGRIGPLMFWDRVLSSAEQAQLWNAGAGLAYEEW